MNLLNLAHVGSILLARNKNQIQECIFLYDFFFLFFYFIILLYFYRDWIFATTIRIFKKKDATTADIEIYFPIKRNEHFELNFLILA